MSTKLRDELSAKHMSQAYVKLDDCFKAGFDAAEERAKSLIDVLQLIREMIAVSKRKGHLDSDLALKYIREALVKWEE